MDKEQERFYLKDPNTYSNYNELVHYHIHTDFTIDFNQKIIYGFAVYSFRSLKQDLEQIILDLKNLTIDKITYKNIELSFEIKEIENATPLHINLSHKFNLNEEFEITIHLKTKPSSDAIQWLEKEQTLGKQHPYLFTQGECTLSRQFFPNQDTPSIKSTFSTVFKIEAPLVVAWTGLLKEKKTVENLNIFTFEQNIPIPSYLYALVAGFIEFKEISHRVGVYAEKELIDKAVHEFEDTEAFLKIAENYLTPYEWGRYDIVVLPLGFPFGGMENPNLTFVTPSLLAGDKSLADVIAHEIAHSWTGNLVTNSNWQNFWLNEGFTTFLERKIVKLYYGNDLFCLSAYDGYQDLIHICSTVTDTSTSLSPLVAKGLNLLGSVQYDKGFLFLHYLEGLVGEDIFQKILKSYILKFRLKSVTYKDFKEVFEENLKKEFVEEKVTQISEKIDWNHWIFENGLPNIKFEFKNNLIDIGNNLAEKYLNLQGTQEDKKIFYEFHTKTKLVFLEYLFNKKITYEIYHHIDLLLGLNEGQNDDVSAKWYEIVLKNGIKEVIPFVVDYVGKVGRMKYLKPVYKGLIEVDKEIAQSTFNKNRSSYNIMAVRGIENILSKN